MKRTALITRLYVMSMQYNVYMQVTDSDLLDGIAEGHIAYSRCL
jgi:hypothetical protein